MTIDLPDYNHHTIETVTNWVEVTEDHYHELLEAGFGGFFDEVNGKYYAADYGPAVV